jgi:hypothetical protein
MIVHYARVYAASLHAIGVEPPMAIFASLLNVKGMLLLQDFFGTALPNGLPSVTLAVAVGVRATLAIRATTVLAGPGHDGSTVLRQQAGVLHAPCCRISDSLALLNKDDSLIAAIYYRFCRQTSLFGQKPFPVPLRREFFGNTRNLRSNSRRFSRQRPAIPRNSRYYGATATSDLPRRRHLIRGGDHE